MSVDDKLLDDLANALIKLQLKGFTSELNKANVERYRNGIVTDINDDGTATVELAFCTLENVPNFSGSTLNSNQKVKIFYNNKNMADCYIGAAF